MFFFFFFQAEDGIRDVERSRGLGDVYKRQVSTQSTWGFEKGRARAVRFSKWLRTKILDTEGISGSEVMVVSHSVFLAHLVATKFNDYGKAVVPRIKNCDPFKFDLSTIPQQEIIYLSLIHI
eukprot:TRINITY_DN4089_c0_g2_i5.p1 TRINITY_DN4089_c0_g2~~TRINITY_DN4089_c0_g2_i5.p1  ORF type:complete len:122 (-),score=37.58 TRINITY_DN4089_c0_g2_i5:132-497(-)